MTRCSQLLLGTLTFFGCGGAVSPVLPGEDSKSSANPVAVQRTRVAEVRAHPEPAGVAMNSAPLPSRWVAPTTVGLEGNGLQRMDTFYTALLRLARGERSAPVRIGWLGDSHTQPDIWTQGVRGPLQVRFGIGGPGFIHVGWKKWGYRHAGADLFVEGPWRIEPPRLVSFASYDDGVLGLGGVRLVPQPGARAGVRVKPSMLPGPGVWELAFRFRGLDGHVRISFTEPSQTAPLDVYSDVDSQVRHISWISDGPGGGFEVETIRGEVELFGVVAELAGKPGVVLDVLGLNGAQAAHALAWNEDAWRKALSRRKYDLIVLAYGTNEAGMRGVSMERHRSHLDALLDRIRSASPEADCLVVGAMDRGGLQMSEKMEKINAVQEAAAEDGSCAFWSAQRAMGGRGSMQRWLDEEPPLAVSDRVHLHVRGYEKLGDRLARDMMDLYEKGGKVPSVGELSE